MKRVQFTAEFKAEAIKQVAERGYTVADVSRRLGVSDKSLYNWLSASKKSNPPEVTADISALKLEIARLKVDLKRTAEERDILKKAAVYFASQPG